MRKIAYMAIMPEYILFSVAVRKALGDPMDDL